jgi:uncharacterized membrane protein YbjE (DUF340 family)
MWTVLLIIALGFGAGMLVQKKKKVIRINEKLTSVSIFLLLFVLGISLGQNREVLGNLGQMSIQVVVITSGAILGSVLISLIIYHYFFRGKHED